LQYCPVLYKLSKSLPERAFLLDLDFAMANVLYYNPTIDKNRSIILDGFVVVKVAVAQTVALIFAV